ncbi:hypothetical protein PCANC_03907 [Puccinia coronata f. sp. avenae]|uniref:Uncharacterized protein n=1 Tax=Puccinia coronata f. sp. avenae TaxID=200324 RepID=A0A2N5T5X2_9BASI|nr:hypothetical protein PCANC_08670 [Puccinia coronata f. sp. avenae]PLW56068.1 hypothetical protein PCANC_03907 [Puccinia coronata f. sp. avenae]
MVPPKEGYACGPECHPPEIDGLHHKVENMPSTVNLVSLSSSKIHTSHLLLLVTGCLRSDIQAQL